MHNCCTRHSRFKDQDETHSTESTCLGFRGFPPVLSHMGFLERLVFGLCSTTIPKELSSQIWRTGKSSPPMTSPTPLSRCSSSSGLRKSGFEVPRGSKTTQATIEVPSQEQIWNLKDAICFRKCSSRTRLFLGRVSILYPGPRCSMLRRPFACPKRGQDSGADTLLKRPAG